MPPYASPGDRFSDSLPNQLTKPLPSRGALATQSRFLSCIMRRPVAFFSLFSVRGNDNQEESMATYKDLLAQKVKLEEQLEAARQAELVTAVQQVRQIVQEYGLTAEDLGLTAKAKKRKIMVVPPKYMDPKTGATWSGRGRAPA